MALWPKRSKKISPGCIVITPMRGVAALAAVAKSHSSKATREDPTLRVRMHAHVERMQSARVGARHAEAEAAQREFFAGFGQVPDRRGEQPADGVVFVVVEIRAEAFVEVG